MKKVFFLLILTLSTSSVFSQQKSGKVNELDWFAAYILNPTKDYIDFKVEGFNEYNTFISSKEKYRNIKKVIDYCTVNGKFNEAKFSKTYAEAVRTYNVFISGNINGKSMRKYRGTPFNPYAEEYENGFIIKH